MLTAVAAICFDLLSVKVPIQLLIHTRKREEKRTEEKRRKE